MKCLTKLTKRWAEFAIGKKKRKGRGRWEKNDTFNVRRAISALDTTKNASNEKQIEQK